ncbi:hypothetical protein FBY33_3625 [Arthrobacter sp. SLBN-112]|nr:hypothetical protein [Arthrobacter sp. SLBN-112]TQJ41510.1 hypothetical protein FBY33_3625 [Arthrobacter sp. SLBN-112]
MAPASDRNYSVPPRPPRLDQICTVIKTLAAAATPIIAWLSYEYMSRH